MNKLYKSFLLCALWCIVVSVPVLGTTPGVPDPDDHYGFFSRSDKLKVTNNILYDNVHGNYNKSADATNVTGVDPLFDESFAGTIFRHFTLTPSSPAGKTGLREKSLLDYDIANRGFVEAATCRYISSGAYFDNDPVDIRTADLTVCTGESSYKANLTTDERITYKYPAGIPTILYYRSDKTPISDPTSVSIEAGAVEKVFYVRGQTAKGSLGTFEEIKITVNANPTVQVTDQELCSGETFTLTDAVAPVDAGITLKYYTKNEETYTELGEEALKVTPDKTTIYYVQATNNTTACKSGYEPIEVKVYPLPVFTLKTTHETLAKVCGVNLDLSSLVASFNNGIMHYYSDPSCGEESKLESSIVTSSGTYYLRAENSVTGCMSEKHPEIVSINQVPTPTLIAPVVASAVQGQSGVTYTTQSGMTGYDWKITGGTIDSGQGTYQVSVTWKDLPSGSISVKYTSPEGCPAITPAEQTVTIKTQESATFVSGDFTVCPTSGDYTYETQGEKFNYAWSITGGGAIKSGSNSNKITVEWDDDDNKIGTVSVSYRHANDEGFPLVSVEKPVAKQKVTHITKQPEGGSTCSGTDVTMKVTAEGEGTLTYEWLKDGLPMTVRMISEDSYATSAKGDYKVTVTGECGSETSTAAKIENKAATTITTQPEPFTTVCEGVPVELLVEATGEGTVSYQWFDKKGGLKIDGEESSTYSPTTSGTYYVKVTGECAVVTGNDAVVTINPLPVPTITGDLNVAKDQSGVIYKTESGMRTYQWTVNGGTIKGAVDGDAITVDWGSDNSGEIIVSYRSKGCAPATPGKEAVAIATQVSPTISGDFTVCPTSGNYTYVTEEDKFNYVWTITGNGAITGGGNGSNTITVKWDADNETGNVSVSYRHADNKGLPLVSVGKPVTKQKVTSITKQPQGGTVCFSGNVPLSVEADHEGAVTYQWKKDGENIGGDSPDYTAIASGKYTVEVKATCGSATSDEAVVTVKSQPVAELNGTDKVVTTQQVTYTAGSGSDYNWSVSGGIHTGGTSADQQVTVTWGAGSAGSVSVSYMVDGCPTTTATRNVTVSAQGTPTIIDPATSVCFGTDVNYSTQTNKFKYKWTVTGGEIDGSANEATVKVKWGSAGKGTIHVEYSDNIAADAKPSGETEITINDKPSFSNISTPSGVCSGIALTLTTPTITAIPAATNQGWKLDGLDFTSGSTVTYAQNGKKLLYSATNTCGTGTTNEVSITVYELPTVTLQANDEVCLDTDITFTTETDRNNYVWDYAGATSVTNGGTSAVTMQWNNSGNKTVSVNYTDANGCTATASQTKAVTVKSRTTATLEGPEKAYTTQEVTYKTDNTNSGSNYIWNFNGATVVSGDATASPLVEWATSGTKAISVSYTVDGCPTTTATRNVTVSSQTPPSIINPATSVCYNTTQTYNTQQGRYHYKWSVTGGTFVDGINDESTVINDASTVTVKWGAAGEGTLRVEYSWENTADPVGSETKITINGVPLFSDNITSPDGVCSGTALTLTTPIITATPVATSQGWKLEDDEYFTPSSKVTSTQSGKKLWYSATNTCGTGKTNEVPITVYELPKVTLQANNEVCLDTDITFTTETGQSNYVWVLGGETPTSGGALTDNTVTMQWNNPGNKTVSVNYTDNHGCTATSSQTKTVTVKSQPVAILDGTNGVVATQRVTYTAGPGSNYTWTVSGNYELVDGSALTDKTVNVKWNTAGNVSVSVSYYAENGCLTNTKTLNIVVSPPGTPDISGETSVCDNTNHDYSTQTDRYNYKWSVTGGTIQGADNQPGVTVKWGSAGKGILKVKYSEASTSDQIESTGTEVTINSVPSISNISTPAGVCDGMALVLSEPTITNIPPQVSSEGWKLNEVAFISGDEVNHAQHHGKSLYYEATNFCGSNKSNVVIITVHELPEVKLTANDNVCFDTEITFTTDAGQKSYEWKYAHDVDATLVAGGGTSDNTATLRWNSSGNKTISVNYTDNHGCTATSPQSKVVTVKSKAVATLSGAAAVVVTQETTYTAGMGSNYNWDFGDGATIVSGAATATPLVKWTTTGKKTVSVNYLIDGCPTNVKTLEVEVSGQGTPVIGGAASVCFDQTQEYSTEQGNYKYEWFIEGGDFVGGIKNEYKVTVKWGSAGEGSLIVKYSKSPASEQVESNKKEITINGLPSIGAISTPPSGVCFGAILTLSDPEVTSSFTIDSKGWKLGGSPFTSGSTVSYTPDNYSLVYEATDVCGTAEKAVTGGITVHELPTVTIVPIPSACPGTPIDLETAVGNPDGHTLLFYTQLTGGTPLSDPEVSPSVESNYYVAAVNATTSCVSAERKLITVTIGAVATITKQPVSPGVVGIGGSFELSVEATGSNLHYQWYKGVDELPGAGAKLATYSVSSAVESDYGEYYVIVSGDCNSSQESNKVTVHILNPDATLKDLQVNGITVPDFDPQTTEYTCVLPCDVVLADITGIPNDNDAKVDNKTNQTLEPGDNEYAIKVTAANGFTTKIYKVNINRECYVPKIVKDLEDTIVCVNSSHTFEIEVEGKGLTYEWYYGNRRILGANTNRYTISRVQLSDYEKYYVIVRSNYNGYRASTYSRQARLWVADQLPETLRFATYPDPATTGKTYHIRLAGYSDVTEYKWSYRIGTTLAVDQNAVAQNSNDDVTFSPEIGAVGENETWATFGTLSEGTGTLTATLTHPCGTRVATQTIRVTYPTGTENVTADRITIYPNPTAGVIRISNTVSNQEVKITDVTGSLKGSYRTQEGTTTIDLTGYLKGAYMIQYAGKTYKVIRK